MPSSNRIRVLDLGMQTVKLAEFHASADGSLTLDGLFFNELMADPGADAMRTGLLKAAITQLEADAGVKGGPVAFALPSQAVFARYLALPGNTAEDLKGVIAFEAQQNIPFPIDDVVWDYQALGEPVDGKLNVVLVAIKTDTLEEVTSSVVAARLRPELIDVSPAAIYNAFRFNYDDMPGCSMLIDIGARTTNLLFIEGTKAYSRSIPIGGSAISVAAAKESKQTVEAAELMKREKGFVSLGGNYAEPDDQTAALISKLARTTLTRLHAEIARSISFYRANQSGNQPMRAMLAGGASGMPYIYEFFSEKLQMPVEFFNPLRNVRVSPNVNQELLGKNIHCLGEVVGLALRRTGETPIEINLRPPSVVREQTLRRRKPYLIAAAACLFLALGQWAVYFNKAAAIKETVLAEVAQGVASLENLGAALEKADTDRKKLEATAAPLLTAAVERELWIRIIDELGAKLPPDYIWITRMTPLSGGQPVSFGEEAATRRGIQPPAPAAGPRPGGGQRPGGRGKEEPAGEPPAGRAIDALEIQGLYLENPKQATVIDDYVKSLQDSELFAIKPGDEAGVVRQRSTPDQETWAYGYTLVLPLKTPISLP